MKWKSNPRNVVIGWLVALSLGNFVAPFMPIALIAAVAVLINLKRKEALSLDLNNKEFFYIALYSVAFPLASIVEINEVTDAWLILTIPFLSIGYISGMLMHLIIPSKIGYPVGLAIGIYFQVYLVYVFYRHAKLITPNKSLKDAP